MQDTYFHTDLSSIFRAETKLNWFRKHVVQETISGMEKEQAAKNAIYSKH